MRRALLSWVGSLYYQFRIIIINDNSFSIGLFFYKWVSIDLFVDEFKTEFWNLLYIQVRLSVRRTSSYGGKIVRLQLNQYRPWSCFALLNLRPLSLHRRHHRHYEYEFHLNLRGEFFTKTIEGIAINVYVYTFGPKSAIK